MDKETLRLLKAALIAYRLARLVVYEDGPFDLATSLRSAVVMRTDRSSWVRRGMACPHCVAFWLALPALWLAGRRGGGWLAVAGLASAVQQLTKD